jgi:hypothetical protein
MHTLFYSTIPLLGMYLRKMFIKKQSEIITTIYSSKKLKTVLTASYQQTDDLLFSRSGILVALKMKNPQLCAECGSVTAVS